MRRAEDGSPGRRGNDGQPGPQGLPGAQGTLPGFDAVAITAASTNATDVGLAQTVVPAQGCVVIRVQFVAVRADGDASFKGTVEGDFRNPTGSLAILDSGEFGDGAVFYRGGWSTIALPQRPRIVFSISGSNAIVSRRGMTGVGITWQTTVTIQRVEPAI